MLKEPHIVRFAREGTTTTMEIIPANICWDLTMSSGTWLSILPTLSHLILTTTPDVDFSIIFILHIGKWDTEMEWLPEVSQLVRRVEPGMKLGSLSLELAHFHLFQGLWIPDPPVGLDGPWVLLHYENFVNVHSSGEGVWDFHYIFKKVYNPKRVKNHGYMKSCAYGGTWTCRLEVEKPECRLRVWRRSWGQWKVPKILSYEPHHCKSILANY